MTGREFIKWALEGVYDEYNLEDALYSLGSYLGKGDYFVQFPDAEVVDDDGKDLEDGTEEPANFQEYWEGWFNKPGPGRPALPPDTKRRPRTIKLSDAEWREIQTRAQKTKVSASEYIRRKALTGWEGI